MLRKSIESAVEYPKKIEELVKPNKKTTKETINKIKDLIQSIKEESSAKIVKKKPDQKIKVDLVETVYSNEEKKLSYGASNFLIISQRKMQLLQTKQALIQKEYELYKSEVQLKTHTNPIQL